MSKALPGFRASSSQIQPEVGDATAGESTSSFYANLFASNELTTAWASDSGQWCGTCQLGIGHGEDVMRDHLKSIVHQLAVNQQSTVTPPIIYQWNEHNSVGYRLLRRAGWNEEEGLGAQGQGILYPIRTRMKTDRAGIGRSLSDRGGQRSSRSAIEKEENLRDKGLSRRASKRSRACRVQKEGMERQARLRYMNERPEV